MVQTVFVYFTLILLMLLFNYSSIYLHERVICIGKANSNIPLFSLFLFALVFGVRYNVGIDHLSYLNMYETSRLLHKEADTEFGFKFIIDSFVNLGFHYSVFFFFLAFLQVFLVFYALKECYKLHHYIIVTFFLLTTFLNFMNGIRQELAFCFWLLAVTFIAKKKIVLYFMCILAAISFHISAIITLPFYFFYLIRNSFFNNVKYQLIMLFTSLAIMVLINPTLIIFASLAEIAKMLGYTGYVGMALEGDMSFVEPERERGIGFWVILFLNFILILLSPKVKAFFKSHFFDIMYDFYFVGVLYLYLASGSLALQRVNYYFYNFNFIIGAFTLYYLVKKRSLLNSLLYTLLILLYVLIFYAIVVFRGIDSCAIYHTFW